MIAFAAPVPGPPPESLLEPVVVAVQQDQGATSVEAFVGHRPLGFQPFAGQEVLLTIEMGLSIDRLEAGLDPLFLRAMDLPVQILAPGFADSAELRRLPSPERSRAPGAAEGVELVFGEEVVRSIGPLARSVDGVEFAVFELSHWVRPEAPGDFDLAAPVLRYRPRRSSSDAEPGPLGRVGAASGPVMEVSGVSALFHVREVPPSELEVPWSGVVAAVDLHVMQVPQRVVQDEPFTLLVGVARRSSGPGPSGASVWPRLDLSPPPLKPQTGLELLGSLQESREPSGAGGAGVDRFEADWTGTVWRYDLIATQAGSFSTPALEWAVFDPLEERHKLLRVEPLPVFVSPPRPQDSSSEASGFGADSLDASPAERFDFRWGFLLAAVLAAVVPIARLRHRARPPGAS